MLTALLRRLRGKQRPSRASRVDGVTAAAWWNGFYTRNRKDLPYPPSVPELEKWIKS